MHTVWSDSFPVHYVEKGFIDSSADREALMSDCADEQPDLKQHYPHIWHVWNLACGAEWVNNFTNSSVPIPS